MQRHPEHNDEPQANRSRRGLVVGGLVAVVILVIVLLHLLGVIHG
jgi:hypothetical protein